jgi:quercetin dioxygenase-like cupin family protein
MADTTGARSPREAALGSSEYFSAHDAQPPTGPGRFLKVDDAPLVSVSEGLEFRPILGEGMLFSFVSFAPHAEAARHTHSEEQAVIVLDGELEFDLDGDVRTLRKGDVVVIPPWVPHGARTLDTSCRELDVFRPPRRALLDLLPSNDTLPTDGGS